MTFAYVCIVIALILPMIWAGIAKKESKIPINNNAPRDHIRHLQGRAKNAYGVEQKQLRIIPTLCNCSDSCTSHRWNSIDY